MVVYCYFNVLYRLIRELNEKGKLTFKISIVCLPSVVGPSLDEVEAAYTSSMYPLISSMSKWMFSSWSSSPPLAFLELAFAAAADIVVALLCFYSSCKVILPIRIAYSRSCFTACYCSSSPPISLCVLISFCFIFSSYSSIS